MQIEANLAKDVISHSAAATVESRTMRRSQIISSCPGLTSRIQATSRLLWWPRLDTALIWYVCLWRSR